MAKMDASSSCLTFALLISIVSSSCKQLSYGKRYTSTLTVGQQLQVSNTIISAGGHFELGFFCPENSRHHYLGIWFKKALSRPIVWVANRASPLTTSSPFLTFREDGNLVIMEGHTSIFNVTNVALGSNTTSVTLLDSGNLVLQDRNSRVLWQSFDYPTDTLLPGMKYGYDKTTGKTWSLKSWRNPGDPSPGICGMALDPGGSGWSFISKQNRRYGLYWTAHNRTSSKIVNIGSGKVYFTYNISQQDVRYLEFDVHDKNFFIRYVLEKSGQLQLYIWSKNAHDWIKSSSLPETQCDFYGYSGNFAICSPQSGSLCSCLPGYQPISPESWQNENYGGGCKRKTTLKCSNVLNKYGFSMVPNVTLPADPVFLSGVDNIRDCESACINNCSCIGYSYNSNRCSIFVGDITNVQHLIPDNDIIGWDLYIKVSASDLLDRNQISHRTALRRWKLWIIAIVLFCITVFPTAIFIYCKLCKTT